MAIVVAIVMAIVMACVVAIVLGWCTHLQLLKYGIVALLVLSIMLAILHKSDTSIGRPAANPQYLVILPEPNFLMFYGGVMGFTVIVCCIMLVRGAP